MEDGGSWRCHVDQLNVCPKTDVSAQAESQSDNADYGYSPAPEEDSMEETGLEESEDSASEDSSDESAGATMDHEASITPSDSESTSTGHRYPLRDRVKHCRSYTLVFVLLFILFCVHKFGVGVV